MIVLVLAILGAVLGALSARRREGATLDIMQYATGYAIAFALVGLVATIFIHRMAI